MISLEILSWEAALCYVFLYVSVLCLWVPYRIRIPVWSIVFSIACILGLLSNQIEWYAIFVIILIAYVLQYIERKRAPLLGRVIAGVIVLLMAYALGAHKILYFHNLKVLSDVYISKESIPFTLYINFDKTIVGLFILGLTQRLLSNKNEWSTMFKQTIHKTIMFVVILVLCALIAGKVHFDPKMPACLPIWVITNLLLVCTAEEAFFRGFIQEKLAQILQRYEWGNVISVIIASLLFGFAHYAGGIDYSIWGTFAGLGYGLIYQKTRRIESSILMHFCLNLTHFLFFTYPALA